MWIIRLAGLERPKGETQAFAHDRDGNFQLTPERIP
jgi:hypothetical protein